MNTTSNLFDEVILKCVNTFSSKMKDYGSAWRILRLSSLTDQIFIKAQRIRNLQILAKRKVDEGQDSEFIGIVNYSIISLIQIKLGIAEKPDLNTKSAIEHFDKQVIRTFELMKNKNHDYDEAWKDMRIASFTDLILQKLLRIKQIEENNGKTSVSEGIEANYQDIANYAIFALILLENK